LNARKKPSRKDEEDCVEKFDDIMAQSDSLMCQMKIKSWLFALRSTHETYFVTAKGKLTHDKNTYD
jgi:hypothetical protein